MNRCRCSSRTIGETYPLSRRGDPKECGNVDD
jgi:hypothetical protein